MFGLSDDFLASEMMNMFDKQENMCTKVPLKGESTGSMWCCKREGCGGTLSPIGYVKHHLDELEACQKRATAYSSRAGEVKLGHGSCFTCSKCGDRPRVGSGRGRRASWQRYCQICSEPYAMNGFWRKHGGWNKKKCQSPLDLRARVHTHKMRSYWSSLDKIEELHPSLELERKWLKLAVEKTICVDTAPVTDKILTAHAKSDGCEILTPRAAVEDTDGEEVEEEQGAAPARAVKLRNVSPSPALVASGNSVLRASHDCARSMKTSRKRPDVDMIEQDSNLLSGLRLMSHLKEANIFGTLQDSDDQQKDRKKPRLEVRKVKAKLSSCEDTASCKVKRGGSVDLYSVHGNQRTPTPKLHLMKMPSKFPFESMHRSSFVNVDDLTVFSERRESDALSTHGDEGSYFEKTWNAVDDAVSSYIECEDAEYDNDVARFEPSSISMYASRSQSLPEQRSVRMYDNLDTRSLSMPLKLTPREFENVRRLSDSIDTMSLSSLSPRIHSRASSRG